MSKRSFTLVEVLVVAGIIGVISSVAVLNFSRFRARARDQKRQADLATIQSALEIYFVNSRAYPQTLAELAPSHLPSVPNDPKPDVGAYVYQAETTNLRRYVIRAQLELNNLPDTLQADINLHFCQIPGRSGAIYVSGVCTHPNFGKLYQVSSGG